MTAKPTLHGILAVDKPAGVTSHDVVAFARRALGTRAVGHAGTLDPMATGVLVLLVGEATKLSSHLTAEDKSYRATVKFGVATDSLDADGAVAETREVDAATVNEATVRAALAAMVGAFGQVPPAVSAIKVDGEAMHERTRRGEVVELPPRDVTLHEVDVEAFDPSVPSVTFTARVSKGFYVRSLARDLATAVGTLGHLTSLRRLGSGAVRVEDCLDGAVLRAAKTDEAARVVVREAVRGWEAMGALMRVVRVGEAATKALGYGQRVATEEGEGTALVLAEDGAPVCVGAVREGVLSVVRGIRV